MSAPRGLIATFDHREFPMAFLAELKGDDRISVCIPARDEAATVGSVVATVREALVERIGLVDEIVVVDDGSLDGTALAALRAGARVVPSSIPIEGCPPAAVGKGDAMRAGLAASSGEVVVFLDADVTNLRPHFVSGLVGPLLVQPWTVFVKGCYARSLHGNPTGGGRVTELVARPALSLLFPELAEVAQPLAGETALRRSALEGIELSSGYGVEIALLLDIAERFGVSGIAQVDLGTRSHRNRPLAELAPQAREVLAAALAPCRDADEMSDLVIVSNRGPAAFAVDPDGTLVAHHAAGGVAPSLVSALAGSDALWIAAASSEGDRRAAREGASGALASGTTLRLVELAPEIQRAAYAVIGNGTLWFLYHGLFDQPRQPTFDRRWHEAWQGYREYNRLLAEEVAESANEGATVVVNDYHLALVGGILSQMRPDLRTVHFHHTPFCDADELRLLPSAVAAELLGSLASFGACGFHTKRWADRFRACASAVLDRVPPVFDAALGTDARSLRATADSPGCVAGRRELLDRLDGRALLLRSDRVELSKNLLRGFLAFEELLESDRGLRGRVTFIAHAYPSREDLPEYRDYRQQVEQLVERINERFETTDHLPIELQVSDDLEASVAALSCYDVLLVNPVRDGMNLVAKEGPVVNDRSGVLALSREAGAFAELGPSCLEVEPFDVSGTAAVLARALAMGADERASWAEKVREIAVSRPPSLWFREVTGAARRPGSSGRPLHT